MRKEDADRSNRSFANATYRRSAWHLRTERWLQSWRVTIDPCPLAAFRILYGIYLFGYFGQFLGRVEILFSSEGVYYPFLIPIVAPTPILAWFLHGATLVAIALFTLGIRSRTLTPIILGLYLYHYFLHFAGSNYSYDRLNLIILGLLCFAPTDRAWALTSTSEASTRVPAWTTHLLRLELMFTYLGSGIFKLVNPYWHDGEIIRMTYLGNWGTPQSVWVVTLGLPDFVYDLLASSVIAFEIVIGPALYSSRTRPYAIVAGTLFHSANWFFLSIPEFMSCVTMYVLFVDSATVRRSGEAIARTIQPGARRR